MTKACHLLWVFAVSTPAWAQSGAVDRTVMRPYEAQVTAVEGNVDRIRDHRPWALSSGERIQVAQVITTGKDGYAHFTMKSGRYFDIFGNSRVIFRENVANTGDLVDVLAGRVRVHLQPEPGQQQERIFCPAAVVSTHQPSTVALAIDEDNTVRIDVIEGEVRVQHTLRPNSEPVVVRAIDAILIRPNEPISRRVDRGSIYRYTAKIWSAITFGHASHDAEPIEGNKLLARQTRNVAF